ncbi:unnamed protein product [Schistocephalus solidus]|uniref:Uncharacterized protein n=1 Tax=Schistocephalus solidus TaxID=70667 RepID=A0A183SPP8_SCHSO|nr:unnamed protein product [Schistocephalus solidus]
MPSGRTSWDDGPDCRRDDGPVPVYLGIRRHHQRLYLIAKTSSDGANNNFYEDLYTLLVSIPKAGKLVVNLLPRREFCVP